MEVSPFAGKPAEPSMLVNVPRLVRAYYTEVPDPSAPEQRVAFGTSGHRGSAFEKSVQTEEEVLYPAAILVGEYLKMKPHR